MNKLSLDKPHYCEVPNLRCAYCDVKMGDLRIVHTTDDKKSCCSEKHCKRYNRRLKLKALLKGEGHGEKL